MTCADCIFCVELSEGVFWCLIKQCKITDIDEPCDELQPDDDVLEQVFDG